MKKNCHAGYTPPPCFAKKKLEVDENKESSGVKELKKRV
jgi:hypothetical protein